MTIARLFHEKKLCIFSVNRNLVRNLRRKNTKEEKWEANFWMQRAIFVKIHSLESPYHSLSVYKISNSKSLDTTLYCYCCSKTAILEYDGTSSLHLITWHEKFEAVSQRVDEQSIQKLARVNPVCMPSISWNFMRFYLMDESLYDIQKALPILNFVP